jgi:hypothetical protein
LNVLLLLFDVDVVLRALPLEKVQAQQTDHFVFFFEFDVACADHNEILRKRLDEDQRRLNVHPSVLQIRYEYQADLQQYRGYDQAVAEYQLQVLLA